MAVLLVSGSAAPSVATGQLDSSQLVGQPGGRTHPVFDLEHGELVHGGLIGLEGAVAEATDSLRLIERMEWRVTIELCTAMRSAAAARDVPFFIVLPPVRDEDESAIVARMSAELAIAGVPHFDLDRKYDDGRRRRRDIFFTSDSHPTPAWHRLVADGLAAELARAALSISGPAVRRNDGWPGRVT